MYGCCGLEKMSATGPRSTIRPEACRFAPRCDYVFAKCIAEDPPLLPVSPQESACWLCENGRRVPRAAEVTA